MSDIMIWSQDSNDILPVTAKSPADISGHAAQLAQKDRKQIVAAFESRHYEMGLNFLWSKTITALKKELSTVGVGLLGEMLGRPDVDEDDDVDDILTARDAIRLAEELGIVSSTDALRLRHTNELVTHFSKLDVSETEVEEIEESEALASLKACVKAVLGRPKMEVARKFIDFREALEGETLHADDTRVEVLKSSPYFFHKLTISVLLNAVKKTVGANLEHALANINTIIPAIWGGLRDSEKWQIGYAYAESYAEGKTTVVFGLKTALLKVRGFDFVPENLRSDTFVKVASEIIKSHEGLNNFYNEVVPVRNLAKLGSVIPMPAFPSCATALLSVVLGNAYGISWQASQDATAILKNFSRDRWGYYINNVLPSDVRILNKLSQTKPRSNWIELVKKYNLVDFHIKEKNIAILINASVSGNEEKVEKYARKIIEEYYGKKNIT